MIEIKKIELVEAGILRDLAELTFLQSHGHSAGKEDMDMYIRFAFNLEKVRSELEDDHNLFHFIYFEKQLAGYSKLIPNMGYEKIEEKEVSKLERIYLKKEFYSKNLGQTIFDFNLNLANEKNQSGIWLYSWVENKRGLKFYTRNGFEIIDQRDFKISANHSNPNYIMYKKI